MVIYKFLRWFKEFGWRHLVGLIFVIICLFCASIGGVCAWNTLKTLPTSMEIKLGHPAWLKRLRFYDQTGQLIYERAQQRVRWIELRRNS